MEPWRQGHSTPHGERWSGWRPPGKGPRLRILPDRSLDVGGPGRDDLAQRAPLVRSSCQRDAAAAWAASARLLLHKPWSSGPSGHPRGAHPTREISSSWAVVEPFPRGHLTEQVGGAHSMPPPLPHCCWSQGETDGQSPCWWTYCPLELLVSWHEEAEVTRGRWWGTTGGTLTVSGESDSLWNLELCG